MNDLRTTLIQGFEYDCWANTRWQKWLEAGAYQDEFKSILLHILTAQVIWHARCIGEPISNPEQTAVSAFELSSRRWVELLRSREIGEEINYENLSGEPFTNSLEEIAKHVINHGTYHRGQLRGIAGLRLHDDFPETDLILYLRAVNTL